MKKIFRVLLVMSLCIVIFSLVYLNIKKYKDIDNNEEQIQAEHKTDIRNKVIIKRVTNTVLNVVMDYNISESIYNRTDVSNNVYINNQETVQVKEKLENKILDKIENNKNDEEYVRKSELVTLEVLENTITNESATLIITDNNDVAFEFGEYFEIEKKENNDWNELNYLPEKKYLLLAYKRDENNQYKFVINWKNEYGILPSGIYRIVKYSNDIKFCSNEFEIN